MKKLLTLICLLAIVGCGTQKVTLTGAPGRDGINGVDGSQGPAGVSCFIQENLIVCGDTTFNLSNLVGPMGPQGLQGIQGIPGLPGQSCVVVAIEDGAQIMCGDESSVVLRDGVDGSQGDTGIQGIPGNDGSSCRVQETNNGALVTCDDGSEVLIPFKLEDCDDDGQDNDGRVTLCHKPGTEAEQTLSVAPSAVPGHLGHGDRLGNCD